MKKKLFAISCLLFGLAKAQTPTVGLIQSSPETYEGYTLIAPIQCPTNNCGTYLIDNCGDIVHQWPTTTAPGLTAQLMPNGNLLRSYSITHPFINAGGRGGGVELWDFNGTLLWDYVISDSVSTQHHEITYLPNGNILALIWNFHDSTECVAMGRNPANLGSEGIWSEKIVEYQPVYPDTALVIWQWDVWDHLIQNFDNGLPNYGDPSIHPELFDINYLGWSLGGADWLHANAIDYNPALDQIAMSCRLFHEVYIIDHSTTLAEASTHAGGNSGKGGDILFRWGNPAAYSQYPPSGQQLHAQHNVHWIKDGLPDAGKLMIFNNGTGRTPVEYSSVDIINPNPDVNGNYSLNVNNVYGPDSAEWSYVAPNPPDFHAQYISGAQRLPNGHTLIDDGTHGTVFEIDTAKNIIWKYVNPVTPTGILNQGDSPAPFAVHGTLNWLFRAPKYALDYPAFTGQTLIPTVPIEQNPYTPNCLFVSLKEASFSTEISLFPNPTSDYLTIKIYGENNVSTIVIKNLIGTSIPAKLSKLSDNEIQVSLNEFNPGMYIFEVQDKYGKTNIFKVLKTN